MPYPDDFKGFPAGWEEEGDYNAQVIDLASEAQMLLSKLYKLVEDDYDQEGYVNECINNLDEVMGLERNKQ